MGGFAGRLSAEPAVQVVELARHVRPRRRARPEMGRGVGRRRGRLPQQGRRSEDMTEIDIHAVESLQDAGIGGEKTAAVVTALAHALYLAATPTFAIMAVLTSVSGE